MSDSPKSGHQKTAVVTGASSGIGAATARALAAEGWHLVVGARRLERLEELVADIGGEAYALDVTDPASVAEFCAAVEECHLLVNNAGGALGVESVEASVEEKWRLMFESNAMGTMRMTKELLPKLRASGDGHVITTTSIAAFETYRGGGGYTAAKHAQRAIVQTLRLELLGEPIKITEIAPGLVQTEFSLVRLGGDEAAADAVYKGMQPLRAPEIAECIRWAASQPSHVNIDEIVVRPRDQARATEVSRRAED